MTTRTDTKNSIKKISQVINLLGRIMGLVIKEQEGIDLLNKVEKVRQLSKAARSGNKAKFNELKKESEKKPAVRKIKDSIQSNRDGWDLPTDGKIISKYNSNSATMSGIVVDGVIGQDILASSSGEVVYAGNDLPGFGQLIIIKHSETFLSAYGYNQDVYVNEGQNVKKGQKIASMGLNSNQVPCLYFEIRRSGKPIDPLLLLSSS